MIANTGKKLRNDTIKPVNMPEPTCVEEDSAGFPATVRLKQRQTIIAIEDRWRIDDEWWRSDPDTQARIAKRARYNLEVRRLCRQLGWDVTKILPK